MTKVAASVHADDEAAVGVLGRVVQALFDDGYATGRYSIYGGSGAADVLETEVGSRAPEIDIIDRTWGVRTFDQARRRPSVSPLFFLSRLPSACREAC
mgnify:CR=1 FL=1